MKMPPSLFKSLEVMQLTGCDKLGKVDGLFQLEAIKSFQTDIINAFGFLDLESMEKIEVELCNNLTLARKRGHIQGLCEFGIFSIFLPGSNMPASFSNIDKMPASVSLEEICHNMKGVKVCISYAIMVNVLTNVLLKTFQVSLDVSTVYKPPIGHESSYRQKVETQTTSMMLGLERLETVD
ncbi:hypothetical protein Vadar_001742 [Vaccinium darrowii]|uniref:Uncharacterized protein n=1 Tax=Vaccinium darrowii TaxID=229202 RepID=A0ACB7WX54_9ERIC|nr:hypothetical protein Vadar_001742 [Vaccinium darrowii]